MRRKACGRAYAVRRTAVARRSTSALERMKFAVAILLVVGYIVAVFAGAPAAGPGRAEWLLPALSVIFVGAYLRLGCGGPILPLGIVVALTLVLPLAVLTWIGLPSHGGWWASLKHVLQLLPEHSPVFGLELGGSILAAVAVALTVIHLGRSRNNEDVPHAP